MKKQLLFTVLFAALAMMSWPDNIRADDAKKPNILVIWWDDIGQSNISAYTRGLVGYKTPNIDRIADEGMMFTDYYGEQSFTAGRASFIMGQRVFRTGLSKVGLPGAELGMREEEPTIVALLKARGYATGQFGKNHLGDKDIHLPTNHGDLTALRYQDWKMIFMEQKAPGTFRVWQEPFVPLRVPFIFNLRRDPYERATITSNTYYDWMLDRAYLLVPAQAYVARFMETFKEFPPRQKAASFSLDEVMAKMKQPAGAQ